MWFHQTVGSAADPEPAYPLTVKLAGRASRLQTGYVANYALVLAMGMFALICVYMVLRRG